MAQTPFKMYKNEEYIECHRPFKLPNGKYSGMIRVYELLNPAKQSMLNTMDWSYKPVIVDPKSATGYNSLEIDGQLVNLEKLVQDLCKSRLRVNKLGYCYFQVGRGVADTTETYGFAFYRLNDLLKWSDYGVAPKPGNKASPVSWDRLDILYGGMSDVKEMEIHQKDNDNTVNEQLKSQNQKLIEQVKVLQAKNDNLQKDNIVVKQLKSQNQKLIDQVKELQAKLDDSLVTKPPNQSTTPNFVSVPRTYFDFKRYPDDLLKHQTILQHWETRLYNFVNYKTRPTFSNGESMIRLTISARHDQQFDTNNWYFVGVEGFTYPVLIYEGTAHSVTVNGTTMGSPLEGNSYIRYTGGGYSDFWFGPLTLTGYGARIGIRYC